MSENPKTGLSTPAGMQEDVLKHTLNIPIAVHPRWAGNTLLFKPNESASAQAKCYCCRMMMS